MELSPGNQKRRPFALGEALEKLKFLSFRGTLRDEESLILLTSNPREIPHFVRNDNNNYFFRTLRCRSMEYPFIRRPVSRYLHPDQQPRRLLRLASPEQVDTQPRPSWLH